ncbi:hypothetical protein VE03_03236 [Pseudogymnoascus sp. 23342-1-I1]|nr:hypothetical protein VE03_03236 [Pseudogymnoascus sp. 23342-1-I1]
MSKLSPPLRPRLLPSMIAASLVALFIFTIFAGNLAHAAEVDSILPDDHSHEQLLDPFISARGEGEGEDDADMIYQAGFEGTKVLDGRQLPSPSELPNNVARSYNLPQGETIYFVFTNESVWGPQTPVGSGSTRLPSVGLSRRWEDGGEEGERGASNTADGDGEESLIHKRANETRSVYITLNTCLQPTSAKNDSGPPPQVTIYVGDNQTTLGADQPADGQRKMAAEFGFANLTFDASKDIYIALTGPNTTDFQDVYSVELVASIDTPYHSYSGNTADLFFIDSDSNSALLATKNLTLDTADTEVYKEWMELSPPPYAIFANNQNRKWVEGVSHSYCGLQSYAQIAGIRDEKRTDEVKTIMTNVTLGNFPKQQFYFSGLDANSEYYGILALPGNDTKRAPGGGGRVWKSMNFTTQSDGNCAILFNLTFCSDVAYAVPGNPTTFPTLPSLAAFYDNAAKSAYDNFAKALQQIPCEIPSTGQYSLVRTCSDCAAAYKAWLCSVTIPRCQDYSSADPWLQPRNVVQMYPNASALSDTAFVSASQEILYLNSSRNPAIDEVVRPGPYKEILPCLDMCYNLVQSCPAAMGFECPGMDGGGGGASSYGRRPDGSKSEEGQITCNYPGAAYHLSGVGRRGLGWGVVVVAMGVWLGVVVL